jgi:uncharacterized protein (TIGR03435 family)
MRPMRAFRAASLALSLSALASPSAQTAFDVASVKENPGLGTGGTLRLMPGGGLTAQHIRANALVTIAYGLQQYQLVNAPGWTAETYYDIQAKPAAPATRDQTLEMLQALLADRFHLVFHRESREIDGFALTRIRSDRLGFDLRPSDLDCSKVMATMPRCRQGAITGNSFKLVGVPIWTVLQIVVNQVHAPVDDDTQLTGTFDADLEWSTDVAPGDDVRSIFTALQERLGLTLERRRVRTDVLVVDRIDHPAPD